MAKKAKQHTKFQKKKRIFKFWLLQNLIAPFAWALIRLYVATLRIDDKAQKLYVDSIATKRPGMLIVWHTHLAMAIAMLIKIHKVNKSPLTILISPSRDAELASQYMEKLGQRLVKGSSNKKAAASLIALKKELEDNQVVILPIDGPKGPRGIPKPGVYSLTQKTGAAALITFFAPKRYIQMKSWDRVMIPLPFTRIECPLIQLQPEQEETQQDYLQRMSSLFIEKSQEFDQDVSDILKTQKANP